MRIVYWLIGAAATAAAGVYLLDRQGGRRTSARFHSALDRGSVAVRSVHSSIPEPGIRQEAIHGVADGTPFLFISRTGRDGLRWTYTLTWTGDAVIGRDLTDLRDALKRLPVVPKDAER